MRKAPRRLAASMILVVPLAIAPVRAADDGDWIVATVAGDGSWGVASDAVRFRAIAAANRACRAMAPAPTDCGAQTAHARDGWIVALLCGTQRILAVAPHFAAAERAALQREDALRSDYMQAMPACRPVLVIDPRGFVTATGPQYVGPP